MKTSKFYWIGFIVFAVIVLGVIGYISSSKAPENSTLVGDGTYSLSLPNGWVAHTVDTAKNKEENPDSSVQVFSGYGGDVTGVSTFDQKSIDEMKTRFSEIYSSAEIKTEYTTIGGEKAFVLSMIFSIPGTRDGRNFRGYSLVSHNDVLYTIFFNSVDLLSRAKSDFQKINDNFKFK